MGAGAANTCGDDLCTGTTRNVPEAGVAAGPAYSRRSGDVDHLQGQDTAFDAVGANDRYRPDNTSAAHQDGLDHQARVDHASKKSQTSIAKRSVRRSLPQFGASATSSADIRLQKGTISVSNRDGEGASAAAEKSTVARIAQRASRSAQGRKDIMCFVGSWSLSKTNDPIGYSACYKHQCARLYLSSPFLVPSLRLMARS